MTPTPERPSEAPEMLDSTVIERPTGGSEVVVHGGSDELAMTAFIAVAAEDVVDLSEMR